jgi:hypothetical protein
MAEQDTVDERIQKIEAIYAEVEARIIGLELEKKQITTDFIKMLEEEKIRKIREELTK